MKANQYPVISDEELEAMLSGKITCENEKPSEYIEDEPAHTEQKAVESDVPETDAPETDASLDAPEQDAPHGSVMDVIASRKNQAAAQQEAKAQHIEKAGDPKLESLRRLIDSRKSGGKTPSSVSELIRQRKMGVASGTADPRDVIFKRKFNRN